MTKVTLSDLVNLNNPASAVSTINSNSNTIELGFDKTLSRDGTAPNQMEAELDMNGRRIINVPAPVGPTDLVRAMDIDGGFSTSTNYVLLSSYASLALAIANIGATQTTLLIDTTAVVASNTTIPATLAIAAVPGFKFTVNTGITLTLKGPMLIPDEQEIFTPVGTGKIDIYRHSIPVGWFGVLPDNADNSPKFNLMLSATTNTGGYFTFAPKTYVFSTNWVIPNTGGTEPTQPSMVFKGAGSHNMGRGDFAPTTGSIIRFSSGVGTAHIATYGTGQLVIEDLTIHITLDTFLPFVYTTYTTVKLNRNCFYGFNHSVNANNDVIIFGGQTNVQNGSTTAPFQGYGSSVTNCAGHRIRRLAYGRVFANAIVVRDNWVWANSGNTLGGCIELDGTGGAAVADFNEGWVVEGNQIETHSYKYFAKLKSAPWNSFKSNHLYDFSGTTLAEFLLEDGSCYRNTFIGGVHTDPAVPFVSDGFNNILNTIIPGNVSGTGRYSEFGPSKFGEFIGPKTNGVDTIGDLNNGWKQLWIRDAAGTPLINFQEGQGQLAWSAGNMFYSGSNVGTHFFNAPVGYQLGSGGTVTQATSKSTAVTLNKVSGAITMNAASLAAGTSVTFTLNNTFINATDVVFFMIKSGATINSYTLDITSVSAGSCAFQLRNFTAGALAEAVVISFCVFRSFHS